MKTYIFEWTIKDDNGDDHLVKIKKEERNRYIYLDDIKIDMIPNDFYHSEIFNFEYNFSILNKNAKIIYREQKWGPRKYEVFLGKGGTSTFLEFWRTDKTKNRVL